MKPSALILTSLLLAAGLATPPPPASAQTKPSMQELAIEWVSGRFGSPLLCQIAGEPIRGMRRLQIARDPRRSVLPLARIVFVSMEVETATRCFTDLEKSVPNITGSLLLRFPGKERRDTSNRDFPATLRRTGGLEFDVASGVLRLQEVGGAPEDKRDVDFRGGKARFLSVRPGTDVERMLSAIKSPRKLDLMVSARDGTVIKLPLFLAETR